MFQNFLHAEFPWRSKKYLVTQQFVVTLQNHFFTGRYLCFPLLDIVKCLKIQPMNSFIELLFWLQLTHLKAYFCWAFSPFLWRTAILITGTTASPEIAEIWMSSTSLALNGLVQLEFRRSLRDWTASSSFFMHEVIKSGWIVALPVTSVILFSCCGHEILKYSTVR